MQFQVIKLYFGGYMLYGDYSSCLCSLLGEKFNIL